jgi:hypothetical protein
MAVADSPADLLLKAKQLYYSGIAGSSSDLSQSAQLFDQLTATSNDPSINAYRGSLLLLEAGQTLAVWKKSDLAKRGLTLLDDSVAAHPTNLEIRFVRAATTLHLPFFFKRRAQSCEDFRYIAPKAAEAAASRELDPRIAAGALFLYAKNCATDRVLPAEDAMRQAVVVAPDSPAGQAAGNELGARSPVVR